MTKNHQNTNHGTDSVLGANPSQDGTDRPDLATQRAAKNPARNVEADSLDFFSGIGSLRW